MKLFLLTFLLLALPCATSFGVIISGVDAPQDDISVLRSAGYCRHQSELDKLTSDYEKLLAIHFWTLNQNEIASIFGPKLAQKPDDRVKPMFVPSMIAESGLHSTNAPDLRHIDFDAIGDVGYLEVHYGFDGKSVAAEVIYLRADDKFVPLKSTDDIPAREAWDKAHYEMLKKWVGEHMPRVKDLGVIEVTPGNVRRLDLGVGRACVVMARDISQKTVPYWFSIEISRDTTNRMAGWLHGASLTNANEPVGFAMDGTFYQFTPKLVK